MFVTHHLAVLSRRLVCIDSEGMVDERLRTPTVIGSGLIARGFHGKGFNRNVVVFASGVSKSFETDCNEFDRERKLLEKVIGLYGDAVIVYFSSTGLNFGASSAYFSHKVEMEELLRGKCPRFHVFRLPQVVGSVNNDTLISYFTRSLLQGKVLNISEKAVRNLISVDDVARVASKLVNEGMALNTVQTLASGSNVRVLDVVFEIAAVLNIKPKLNMIGGGDDQSVSGQFLEKTLGKDDPIFWGDYWRRIVRQYVPCIANEVRSAC